jgi:integrase
VSVYKPEKSRFFLYDFQYQGHRFYGSTGQTTRRRAVEVEQAKRLAAAKGESNRPAVNITLDEAAGRYWQEHGQFKKSAKDIDQRIATAVALVGPKTPLKEIDADVIARAIQRRRGKLAYGKKVPSNSTVNRDMIDTTLRPILTMARKVWKIPGVQEIEWGKLRLKEPAPQPVDFSPSELQALDDAIATHWHDFRRFQARYALRLGEMFFPLSAIDVEGRRVWIMRTERKNQHLLAVPLMDDDVAMLAARMGRAKAAKLNTVWFRAKKSGYLRALTYRTAMRTFSAAMTKSGLRQAKGARGTHALRHHGGMQMLRATGNLRTTQKLLGHVSIQSTLTYAHALEGDVRAGLEAVSRLGPEPAREAVENAEEKQRDAG